MAPANRTGDDPRRVVGLANMTEDDVRELMEAVDAYFAKSRRTGPTNNADKPTGEGA